MLSLGLAIGACTAAFALIDALILRELPVREPERLVLLSKVVERADERFSALVSYPFFDRVRQAGMPQIDVFALSHQSPRQALLPDAGGVEEKVVTQFASGNAFRVLGVTPALGRLLQPADDVTPGAHQVAVVSHAFWTRRLGANPRALGSWIQVEQKPYQIVGVSQAGFTGTEAGVLTDVWLPAAMFDADSLAIADVELAAGVGSPRARRHPRRGPADRPDHPGGLPRCSAGTGERPGAEGEAGR